jgi:hypothetical protein
MNEPAAPELADSSSMWLRACCQLPGRGLGGDVPQWHVHLASVTLTVPGTSGLASPCALQRALTTRGLVACQQPEAPVSAVTVVRAFAATGTLALELGTGGGRVASGSDGRRYHIMKLHSEEGGRGACQWRRAIAASQGPPFPRSHPCGPGFHSQHACRLTNLSTVRSCIRVGNLELGPCIRATSFV